jgi:hypothetical protein
MNGEDGTLGFWMVDEKKMDITHSASTFFRRKPLNYLLDVPNNTSLHLIQWCMQLKWNF